MRLFVVIVLLTLLSATPAESGQRAGVDELEALRAGEVTIDTIRTDESGGAARFRIYIEAPVERIWAVIYSCEDSFVFLRGLRLCEVLEDTGDMRLTRQVVKTSWLVPKQDFTFRTVHESAGQANFERIEGSPRIMEGSWSFVALDNGLVATHEIRVKPDLPVPRFIIRHLMQRSMPLMLTCIRALATGSPDEALKVQDRASCGGPAEFPTMR